MEPFIQQLGVAGLVVAVLLAGLRWMAVRFEAAAKRAIELHDKCEDRQQSLMKHMDDLQAHQFDRNARAMHAMAKALDSIATAINDTRTPTKPLRVPTPPDIIPPEV